LKAKPKKQLGRGKMARRLDEKGKANMCHLNRGKKKVVQPWRRKKHPSQQIDSNEGTGKKES